MFLTNADNTFGKINYRTCGSFYEVDAMFPDALIADVNLLSPEALEKNIDL